MELDCPHKTTPQKSNHLCIQYGLHGMVEGRGQASVHLFYFLLAGWPHSYKNGVEVKEVIKGPGNVSLQMPFTKKPAFYQGAVTTQYGARE